MTDAERLADIREKMHEWSAKDIDNDTWHEWVGGLFADHLAAARAEGRAAGLAEAVGVLKRRAGEARAEAKAELRLSYAEKNLDVAHKYDDAAEEIAALADAPPPAGGPGRGAGEGR